MAEKSNRPVVVVVDALRLRRGGVVTLLRDWAEKQGLEIEAVSASSLPSEFEEQPNVRIVVLSIGGQSVSAPEISAALRNLLPFISESPLVVLSDHEESKEIIDAFRMGASGFLPTSMNPEVALEALTFILQGGTYFPASALLGIPEMPGGGSQSEIQRKQARIAGMERSENGLAEKLTDRQRDVANLLRQGLANKIIARQLAMTEATVKVHVRHIMRKLGACNRTQAALLAAQIKSIAPPCPAPRTTNEGAEYAPLCNSSSVLEQHVRIAVGRGRLAQQPVLGRHNE